MVENAWNVSVRKMYKIPRTTHRYLIEPITGMPHIKNILIKRFLRFIQQIENCPKKILGNLLQLIKKDVNSVTGANLRQIMILCGKQNIVDLEPIDANLIEYHPIPVEEYWRVSAVKDIVATRNNQATIEGFDIDELDNMMDFVCTS